MGIRIHKVLGYGLTDVAFNRDSWSLEDDPRFYKDSFLFNENDYTDKYTIEGFIKYLVERVEVMGDDDLSRFELRLLIRQLEDPEEKRKYYFFDSINYDMEMGLDGVMCFVPPSQYKEWVRYDNTIDYYDPVNRSDDGGIKESVIMIDRALYPWESYVNIKEMPPTRLTGTKLPHFYSLKNLGFDNIVDTPGLYESFGVANNEEFRTLIVPAVPLELVELLKYLKIFNKEEDIHQLRPMIYGWWG